MWHSYRERETRFYSCSRGKNNNNNNDENFINDFIRSVFSCLCDFIINKYRVRGIHQSSEIFNVEK